MLGSPSRASLQATAARVGCAVRVGLLASLPSRVASSDAEAGEECRHGTGAQGSAEGQVTGCPGRRGRGGTTPSQGGGGAAPAGRRDGQAAGRRPQLRVARTPANAVIEESA